VCEERLVARLAMVGVELNKFAYRREEGGAREQGMQRVYAVESVQQKHKGLCPHGAEASGVHVEEPAEGGGREGCTWVCTGVCTVRCHVHLLLHCQ
jgi:hypothetical protein